MQRSFGLAWDLSLAFPPGRESLNNQPARRRLGRLVQTSALSIRGNGRCQGTILASDRAIRYQTTRVSTAAGRAHVSHLSRRAGRRTGDIVACNDTPNSCAWARLECCAAATANRHSSDLANSATERIY